MRSVAASLAMFALFVAGTARAATPEEQRLAQALFDDGRRLMEEERFAEACPKLAESQRLDPGGGTLLNLAICYEGEGKLATANLQFAEALREAIRDGRKDREEIARQRLAEIERSVPRVTVVVPPAARRPELSVRLDALELRPAAWGVATEVDPGKHVVEASLPGAAPWRTEITVSAGEKKVVEIPPLAPPTAAAEWRAPPPIAGAPPTRSNVVHTAAVSVAVLGTLTTLATGLVALISYGAVKDECLPDRSFCRTEGAAETASRARTLAWVSTGALVVTTAAIVTAIAVPSRVPIEPRIGVALVPGGGGVSLGGAF
jgi:hypothetical protein